jgi:hypothetical protein
MSKKEKKRKGKEREREGGSVTLSRSEIYASMCQCFCPYSHHGLAQAIHSYSSYIHPSTQSRSDIFLRSLPPVSSPAYRLRTYTTDDSYTYLTLSLSLSLFLVCLLHDFSVAMGERPALDDDCHAAV